MVLNYVEGQNKLKVNDFTCSLMAIITELMVINIKIDGLTHYIINFKKQKVMNDFNRNLTIIGILKGLLIYFNGFCVQ